MKITKINILFISLILVFSLTIIGCGKAKEELKEDNKVHNKEEVKASNVNEDDELEFTNGKRTFKSEVTPLTESQKVILHSLKIEISDKYDEFADLYVDNPYFNYYPRSYKYKFGQGLYCEEITINSIKRLTEDEYLKECEDVKVYQNIDRLKEYNPHEFEIIEVNYTIKLTDKYNKIAQFGDGDWIRYYVIVKEKEDSSWKIFEIYGYM